MPAEASSSDVRYRPFSPLDWLIPIAATVVGLAVIGGHSVATDEAFSWGVAAQQERGDFVDGLRFVSGNMAGYLLLLRGWLLFGDGLVWMRILSLAFHVATVVALMGIADRWYDRRTARIVGLLAASSVPLIYFAVEIRSYSLVALAVTMTWGCLERALSVDSLRSWLWVGFWVGVAVSAQLVTTLLVPVLGLVVLVCSRAGLVGSVLRLLPIGLFSLPTLAFLALGDSSDVEWIPGLSMRQIAVSARFLLGDHAQFTAEGSGFVLAGLFAVLFALAGLAIVRTGERIQTDLLVWVWFLSFPVMLTLVSLLEPLLLHRYLIGSLPGGLLIVARYLAKLERRNVSVALVAVLVLLGTVRTMALRPHSADENGPLAAAIEANAAPGDVLVTPVAWHRVGLEYYWRDGAPVEAQPVFGPDFDHERLVERLDRGPSAGDFEWVRDAARVWVVSRSDSSQVTVNVDRPDDEYDFPGVETSLGSGYELVDQFDVQRFRVRLYERR